MINTLCVATRGFYSGDTLAIATRGFICDGAVVEPPVIEPPRTGGSPGGVRRRKKYAPPIEDSIREHERMQMILREDEEIVEFIKVILTKGLI